MPWFVHVQDSCYAILMCIMYSTCNKVWYILLFARLMPVHWGLCVCQNCFALSVIVPVCNNVSFIAVRMHFNCVVCLVSGAYVTLEDKADYYTGSLMWTLRWEKCRTCGSGNYDFHLPYVATVLFIRPYHNAGRISNVCVLQFEYNVVYQRSAYRNGKWNPSRLTGTDRFPQLGLPTTLVWSAVTRKANTLRLRTLILDVTMYRESNRYSSVSISFGYAQSRIFRKNEKITRI